MSCVVHDRSVVPVSRACRGMTAIRRRHGRSAQQREALVVTRGKVEWWLEIKLTSKSRRGDCLVRQVTRDRNEVDAARVPGEPTEFQ